MPQIVELPDSSTVEFPDGTAPETIQVEIEKAFPQWAKPAPAAAPAQPPLNPYSGIYARAGEEARRIEPGSFNKAFEPPAAIAGALDNLFPSFRPGSPEVAQLLQMAGLEPTRAAAEAVSERLKGAVGSMLSPGGAVLAAAAPAAPGLVGGVVATTMAPGVVEGAKEAAQGIQTGSPAKVAGGLTTAAISGAGVLGGALGVASRLPLLRQTANELRASGAEPAAAPAQPKETSALPQRETAPLPLEEPPRPGAQVGAQVRVEAEAPKAQEAVTTAAPAPRMTEVQVKESLPAVLRSLFETPEGEYALQNIYESNVGERAPRNSGELLGFLEEHYEKYPGDIKGDLLPLLNKREKPLKITAVASRLGDTIQTGRTHFEAEAALRKRLGIKLEDPRVEDIEHGFIDSQGNFLDREQAWEVAERAKQIKPNPEDPGFLGREDLKRLPRNPAVKSSKPKEVTPLEAKTKEEGQVPLSETTLPPPPSGGTEVPPKAAPTEKPAAGKVEPAAPSLPLGITNPRAQAVLDTINDKLWKTREGFKQLWESAPNRAEITRTLDGADTLANSEARQVYNSLRLEGTPADREAAFAIVEANHDYHKLGIFVNQARGKDLRAEKAARLAMSDYTRLEPLARKVESILDAQIAMEQARGINTEYRDAYVPHIIDTDLLMGTKRPIVLAGRGGGLGSGFKKGRVFDTIYDAIEAGYKPKSMDVAQVAEHRVRAGQRLINRIAWGDSMRQMLDPIDRRPVITNMEFRDRGPGKPGFEVAPMGYAPRELLPGIRIAVHEGYASLFDALTGRSVLQDWLPTRIGLQTEGALKHGLLLFDTFHASRIWQKELFLAKGKAGYRKGEALLEYSDPDLAKAVTAGEITPEMAAYAHAARPTADLLMRNGLNVGRIQENLYAEMIRNIPGIGTFNKWVFDKLTRGAMLESGIIEFDRLKRANPALTDKEIAGEVSSRLNTLYGNLGRQGIFKSSSFRDAARLLFLAPQWVESMIGTETGAARQMATGALKGRPLEGTLAKSVGNGLIAYFVGTQLLNLATRGKPTWENEEPGHKLDAWIPDITGKTPGYFLSPFSVVAEVTHDAIRFLHSERTGLKAAARFVGNKLSPLARAEETLRTGKIWTGETLVSDWDRLKAAAIALAPTPIPLSPLTRKDSAGQMQRQLTASLGVKTEPAPSADQQVRELARTWAAKNIDPKIRAAQERRDKEGFTPSDYTPLRKALRVGDTEQAKEEYGKLLETHSPRQIYEALKPVKPVTGTLRNEAQFRNSLTKQQESIYDRALEERRQVFERFLDLEKP